MADLASFLGGLDTWQSTPRQCAVNNSDSVVTSWWHPAMTTTKVHQLWNLPEKQLLLINTLGSVFETLEDAFVNGSDQTADVPTTSVGMHSYHNNKTWDSAATVAQSSAGMRHAAGRQTGQCNQQLSTLCWNTGLQWTAVNGYTWTTREHRVPQELTVSSLTATCQGQSVNQPGVCGEREKQLDDHKSTTGCASQVSFTLTLEWDDCSKGSVLCALVNWPSVGRVVDITLIWYGGATTVDGGAT